MKQFQSDKLSTYLTAFNLTLEKIIYEKSMVN